MTKLHSTILGIILVVGLLTRFLFLDRYPSSLNWDEISHGYNAYSLIQTGKDQWGTNWPLFNFRAYGDYPTTLNMYLSIPFIVVFGLNETSVRLVSALCGFALIIVGYLIGTQIFKDKKSSLFLAFLIAINPWTFFTSRAVFQSTVAQFFMALGVYFLLLTIKKRYIYLLPSLLSLGISTYGYHNTRIVIPLLLLLFLVIYFKKIVEIFNNNKIYSTISIIIFLIVFIPQFVNIFNKDAQARSRWVFIINPSSINQIENNRNNFTGDKLVGKILFNKPVYFITQVSKNYLGFFNPKILFFNSTQNYQFNIPNSGIILPVLLPFFYIGLFFVIKELTKNKDYQLFFGWYLVGLIPAVITSGDFPIIRAMTVLPVPFIFICIGFSKLKFLSQNKKFLSLIITIILISSFIYLKNYFTSYNQKYSQSWQYGYKQVVQFTKENYSNYDQIIVTKKYGEPHEYFLFYWPWLPQKYQNDSNLKWDFHSDWYWVDGFDKFKFINDWEIKDATNNQKDSKILLITSPSNYNSNSKLIRTINFLDNTPAFDILEINE